MTLVDEQVTTHSARRAWMAVVLVAIVGTLNYADRFLPAVLVEPIKNDLALSDTAIGVINGFWFLAVYAVLGLMIARIAVGSAGPFLTGLISDELKTDLGNMSLGRALLIVPVAQVVAIICYLVASQRFMREIVDR